jgi:hypothetical protein
MRKATQVLQSETRLIVLCDDGTIWTTEHGHYWTQLEIPQPTVSDASLSLKPNESAPSLRSSTKLPMGVVIRQISTANTVLTYDLLWTVEEVDLWRTRKQKDHHAFAFLILGEIQNVLTDAG